MLPPKCRDPRLFGLNPLDDDRFILRAHQICRNGVVSITRPSSVSLRGGIGQGSIFRFCDRQRHERLSNESAEQTDDRKVVTQRASRCSGSITLVVAVFSNRTGKNGRFL